MSEIKIKERPKETIKILDKGVVQAQSFKHNIVSTKEKINDLTNNKNEDATQYANDKVQDSMNHAKNKAVSEFNKRGKQALKDAPQNLKNAKNEIKAVQENTTKTIKTLQNNVRRAKQKSDVINKTIKSNNAKKTIKKGSKQTIKTYKSSAKLSKKGIKTAERTAKNAQKAAKESAKMAKRAAKIAKETAKRTVQAIKLAIKATIKAVKAIIAAVKSLISLIAAGGWVAVIIVIVICMIAMVASSVYGVFFSKDLKSKNNEPTIASETLKLEIEMAAKIEGIKLLNLPYGACEVNHSKVSWRDLLIIYSIKTNGGNNQQQVMTLDKEKVKVLHKVYWDMNEIKWHKSLDKEKLIKLHIDIRGKSAQEMAAQYKFNDEQMKMLNDLLNPKYDEQWKEVLRNSDIVKVAETQLGNKGGEPYWSWYGFENRVEWCACFVSWCANQCGYIEAGLIPKFSGCQYGGVTWFKDKNQWQERGYQARSGDIIFFDWDKEGVGRDNSADHVGIVEYVDNGRVHTIEGNSGDECCRRDYDINSLDILGYGTPAYP